MLMVVTGMIPVYSQNGTAAPVLVYPLGQVSDTRPYFQWEGVPGATSYWLLVADQADIGSGQWLINAEMVYATSVPSTYTFAYGKTYYWKVKYRIGDVPYTWSSIESFTVLPPGATATPQSTTPSPGSTPEITPDNTPGSTPTPALSQGVPEVLYPVGDIPVQKPVFRWNPVPDATSYWLLVSDQEDIGSGRWLINEGSLTGTSFASSCTFACGQTYYWKVKYRIGDVPCTWSRIVSFTVNCSGPTDPVPPEITPPPSRTPIVTFKPTPVPVLNADPPELLSPLGNISSQRPHFRWSAVQGATSYWLLVSDQADVGSGRWLINEGTVYGTSFASNYTFVNGRTYYWKVKYRVNDTPGTWSAIKSFTVNMPSPTGSTPWPLTSGGPTITKVPDCIVYVALSPAKAEYKKNDTITINVTNRCNEVPSSVRYELVGSGSQVITNPWKVNAPAGTYLIKVTVTTTSGKSYSGESPGFRVAADQSCVLWTNLIPDKSEYMVGDRIELRAAASCSMHFFSPKFELVGPVSKLLTNPWTVDVTPGSYLIKVTMLGDEGKPYSGESHVFKVAADVPSDILNINVNPGSVAPGENVTISWQYGEQFSFSLFLYKSNNLSSPVMEIVRATGDANRRNRSYIWKVPETIEPGTYRVLVSCRNNSQAVKEKFSDNFTIASVIELSDIILKPDPATPGTTMSVSWKSRGQVRFELKIGKDKKWWFDKTQVVKTGTIEKSATFTLPDWGDGKYYAEVKIWNYRGQDMKKQSSRIQVK